MSDANTVTLSNKARELLNNDAFVSALQRLDDDLMNRWKVTGPEDKDIREALYFEQQGLAAVVASLTELMQEPNMLDADETLDT